MNFSLSPTPFSLSPNTDIIAKLAWFFGHYDLRVYISNKAFVDVGRGSFGAALRLSRAFSDYSGRVATVGQFCDLSATCELLPGGEHRNENNVNVVFSSITTFAMAAAQASVSDLAPSPAKEIRIGNAVVISAGALVMGGVQIGDGAVIGAHALVRSDVEPFCVHAGLPARSIKARVPSERQAALLKVRWWDFDTVYLGNNLARLQELAIDTRTPHKYRAPAPRFALKIVQVEGRPPDVQLLGYVANDVLVGIEAAPPRIRDYLSQIVTPGPYQWEADVWQE